MSGSIFRDNSNLLLVCFISFSVTRRLFLSSHDVRAPKNKKPIEVIFRGNIFDNDGSDDFDLVEWAVTSELDTTTTNPNDIVLIRTWNQTPSIPANEIEFRYSVRDFEVNYYDIDGNVPAQLDDIVQVEVEVLVESNEPYLTKKDGTELYYRSYWKRRIVANNLIY